MVNSITGDKKMEKAYKIIGFTIIGILVIITTLLLLLNHQIDSIKHAVGGKENLWEMVMDKNKEETEKLTTENAVIKPSVIEEKETYQE